MKECIEEWEREKKEEKAAEVLRCFKEWAEEIYFNDDESRLMLAREVWDRSVTEIMKEISETLNIKTRDDFIYLKEKYNLTMY
ncbi:MAG: hypothetical protein ACP5R0_02620 [Thermoplasmata archaeon]